MRRSKKSAIKQETQSQKDKKSSDILAKARELEKGRDVEQLPPGHPANKRQ